MSFTTEHTKHITQYTERKNKSHPYNTPKQRINIKFVYAYRFSDAMDGFGITECGSLACLSNPCRNGAICVEMNDGNDDRTNAANHNYKPQHPYEDNNDEDDGYAFHMMETRQRQPPKTHDKWKCKCPTGYMGTICEISVCDDNPCQYGATCVTFPGSGYLCLCPLGKHGHYCEHSKSITLHYVYGLCD